jgi:hypothetical protein
MLSECQPQFILGSACVSHAGLGALAETNLVELATASMIHSIACLKFFVSPVFFFSGEGNEPRHIHVEQAERYAKF